MDVLAAACESVEVPHPHFPVEDDSDCGSSVTLADNPTLPAHHDENDSGNDRVGEATTPAKRKRSDAGSHCKRQKLGKGLRYNVLDFLAVMIEEKPVLSVCMALCRIVTTV